MKDMTLKALVHGVAAIALWGGAARAAYTVETHGTQVTVNVDAGDEQTISTPFDASVTSFLKTGDGTLTITCANAGLTGDAEIASGVVVLRHFKALGGDSSIQWEAAAKQPDMYKALGAIAVSDGARLEIDAGKTAQWTAAIVKRVRLNGTGPDGAGALCVKSEKWANQDFFFAYVELGGDALLACQDNARYGFRHFDLQGHELTIVNGYEVFFSDSHYMSDGTIRCQCPSVYLKGSQQFAAGARQGRLMLESNGTLDLTPASTRDFSWGIGVPANKTVTVAYSGAWNVRGPLQIDGTLKLSGKSESSITFDGVCGPSDTGAIVITGGAARFEHPVPIGLRRLGGATAAVDTELQVGQADSFGYLGLYGGTYAFGKTLACAITPTSAGMVEVLGGDLTGTFLKLSKGGWGELYVSGGKVRLFSDNSATMPHVLGADGAAGSGGQAVLTLTGAGPSLTAPWGDWLKLSERTEGFTSVVNLNAGVIDVSSIKRGVSTADADVRSRAFLIFNGGVYRQRYNNSAAIFGAGDTALDRVTVYAGGAVFDTPYLATQSADTPLRAPTGRGVAAIALPAGIENERYVGAPEVRISGGGGEGATAHALYDPATLCVTNIEVTCPGWDYTSAPKVVICSADRTVTNACAVTLTEGV